jgi:hypothetical protein
VKHFLCLPLVLVLLLGCLWIEGQAGSLSYGGERAVGAFTLQDGDRVVLLGNTLIEREQRYGWWELALTTRFPGKKVTFRNLGWSGDTVFGESHAGYAYTRTGSANVARGFQHLKEHTLSLKPTVLIIGYGTNESFVGPEGLAKFTRGLETLLDTLAPAKARVVLLSPLRQGDMGRPLPDPSANNKNLRLYSDTIREVAKKRGHLFVDLYDRLGDVGKFPGVSHNGIHLTGRGYTWSAAGLERELGIATPAWRLIIDAKGKKASAEGARLEVLTEDPPLYRVSSTRLPVRAEVTITGLPAGKHALRIDGKEAVRADAEAWAKGVKIDRGPEAEQVEKLRKLLIAKNELYFHRWRPQNETYLFGFRKHEQGNNAREIPQFDPLVAAKEKEIAELSVPVAHTYEITPVK